MRLYHEKKCMTFNYLALEMFFYDVRRFAKNLKTNPRNQTLPLKLVYLEMHFKRNVLPFSKILNLDLCLRCWEKNLLTNFILDALNDGVIMLRTSFHVSPSNCSKDLFKGFGL